MSTFALVLIFGITQGAIYAAVGLGLVLVFGVTDIVNFAHGVFVTFGAFGVILLTPHVGFVPALLITLVGVALAASVVYLGGFQFTIGNHLQALGLSLAILLIVQNLMINKYSTAPRQGPTIDGLVPLFGGAKVAAVRFVVLGLLVVAVALIYLVLKKSWIGLALRVCGDDGFAASTIGLSVRKVGLYAFAVSALLAAAVGVGVAAINPVTPLTGTEYLLEGFVVVIIGGLRSVPGALVAGIGFGIIEGMGSQYISPAYTNLYGFVLMIGVLLVWPNGIFNRAARRAG
jgi:branched-chain amino acid transport system permease protein